MYKIIRKDGWTFATIPYRHDAEITFRTLFCAYLAGGEECPYTLLDPNGNDVYEW